MPSEQIQKHMGGRETLPWVTFNVCIFIFEIYDHITYLEKLLNIKTVKDFDYHTFLNLNSNSKKYCN